MFPSLKSIYNFLSQTAALRFGRMPVIHMLTVASGHNLESPRNYLNTLLKVSSKQNKKLEEVPPFNSPLTSSPLGISFDHVSINLTGLPPRKIRVLLPWVPAQNIFLLHSGLRNHLLNTDS